MHQFSKGSQVNIPEPECGRCGNTNELYLAGMSPEKRCLFFLTVLTTLERGYLEKGLHGWQSIPISGVFGALLTVLEMWGESLFRVGPYL